MHPGGSDLTQRRGEVTADEPRQVVAPRSTVVVGRKRGYLRVNDPVITGIRVLMALGAAFAIIGLVDLVLLWIPPRFDNAAWEFGTLSRTFDSFPLTGLGLGLFAYGVVYQSQRRGGRVRALAVVFFAVALLLIALGVLYATAVPAVLQQTPQAALVGVNRAVIKNALEILVYPLTLLGIAIKLWRQVEKAG